MPFSLEKGSEQVVQTFIKYDINSLCNLISTGKNICRPLLRLNHFTCFFGEIFESDDPTPV